jgi:NAD(P)-dependent dehydrogenase (short-subunit alcohol dehydrogenase family)
LLVTGASRGLGLELCRPYPDAGWRVFACGRKPDAADRLAPIVDAADGRVTLLRMNVDDAEEVKVVATELGGLNAHHSVEEATERVRALLQRLTIEDTGSYWNYDGTRLPW